MPDIDTTQVVCVAEFHAIEGKTNEPIAALHVLIKPTHAEDGCLRYELNQRTVDCSLFDPSNGSYQDIAGVRSRIMDRSNSPPPGKNHDGMGTGFFCWRPQPRIAEDCGLPAGTINRQLQPRLPDAPAPS
jgi:hypothetical protein